MATSGARQCLLWVKQTFRYDSVMSALPPKADIAGCDLDVRFVPEADIRLIVAPEKEKPPDLS